MTKEQGYRLFYWIFEAEDKYAGQIYYGPAQKMIHFIPLIPLKIDEFSYENTHFFCLGEFFDWYFINNMGEMESLWIDTVDERDRHSHLKNDFAELLYSFDTELGKHVIINALAHNEVIRRIFRNRIELWSAILNAYMQDKDYSNLIPTKWPSTGKATLICDDVDFVSQYELDYKFIYREFYEKLFELNASVGNQLKLIAENVKLCFEVEKEFINTRINAIKILAEPLSSTDRSIWKENKDPIVETVLNEMKNHISKVIPKEDITAIKEQTAKIPEITTSIIKIESSVENNSNQLNQFLTDPIPIQFRMGIECGALEPGDEEDPRYRVIGLVRSSFLCWLNYLYRNGIELEDLPTSASTKGKLRRKEEFHLDVEMENKAIKDALDRAKTNFYSQVLPRKSHKN